MFRFSNSGGASSHSMAVSSPGVRGQHKTDYRISELCIYMCVCVCACVLLFCFGIFY